MREVLEKRSRRKSANYAVVYDAIIKHIGQFSKLYDCDIFTNSITEEFLDDFIIYLENQNLRHNTIVGYILNIQSMVRKASQYNYAVDSTYDEINMQLEETNAVFLSMNEITRIYYYKFLNQDKSIVNDFGKIFYHEWNTTDWTYTWELIADCISLYLRYGYINTEKDYQINNEL